MGGGGTCRAFNADLADRIASRAWELVSDDDSTNSLGCKQNDICRSLAAVSQCSAQLGCRDGPGIPHGLRVPQPARRQVARHNPSYAIPRMWVLILLQVTSVASQEQVVCACMGRDAACSQHLGI